MMESKRQKKTGKKETKTEANFERDYFKKKLEKRLQIKRINLLHTAQAMQEDHSSELDNSIDKFTTSSLSSISP